MFAEIRAAVIRNRATLAQDALGVTLLFVLLFAGLQLPL